VRPDFPSRHSVICFCDGQYWLNTHRSLTTKGARSASNVVSHFFWFAGQSKELDHGKAVRKGSAQGSKKTTSSYDATAVPVGDGKSMTTQVVFAVAVTISPSNLKDVLSPCWPEPKIARCWVLVSAKIRIEKAPAQR
jgi:hypothetical protein